MLKFFKEPEYDVKYPVRDAGNAGIDFYIPNYSEAFEAAFKAKNDDLKAELLHDKQEDKWFIKIHSHGAVNIPSGIRCRIDKDVALEANNKSGIAMKKGLVYGASVIDPNYQGIIHCHMINTTDDVVYLDLGTKIVQFIPRKIDIEPVEYFEGTYEDFYKDFEFNNRGDGAFGSTGLH